MSLAGYTVVYGGSFDPPHMGHQMACLYLLEALEAAEVWLIPAAKHPFGKPLSDVTARLAMCQVMAAIFASRVRVSDVEVQLGGAGRTYDTLTYLQTIQPHRAFALAVGADLAEQTSRWYRWADIVAMVPVVVVGRSGYSYADRLQLPEVSSTELRQRLVQGEPVDGWVPAGVARYIVDHQLYRDA